MGQIVGGAAKPKRCNLNKLSQLGTPAAGEYILVSSDNSMNAAGNGYFDSYIVGDGTTPASTLNVITPLVYPYMIDGERTIIQIPVQPIVTNGGFRSQTLNSTSISLVTMANFSYLTINGVSEGEKYHVDTYREIVPADYKTYMIFAKTDTEASINQSELANYITEIDAQAHIYELIVPAGTTKIFITVATASLQDVSVKKVTDTKTLDWLLVNEDNLDETLKEKINNPHVESVDASQINEEIVPLGYEEKAVSFTDGKYPVQTRGTTNVVYNTNQSFTSVEIDDISNGDVLEIKLGELIQPAGYNSYFIFVLNGNTAAISEPSIADYVTLIDETNFIYRVNVPTGTTKMLSTVRTRDKENYWAKILVTQKSLDWLSLKETNFNDSVNQFLSEAVMKFERSYKAAHHVWESIKKPIDFNGKTLVAFGDSITYGISSPNLAVITDSYIKLFSDNANVGTLINKAQSGTTFIHRGGGHDICDEITSFTGNADIIWIAGGTNDFAEGSQVGEWGDDTNDTMYGSLKIICEYIASNFPNAIVIFITPLSRTKDISAYPSAIANMDDYRSAIYDVATYYGYNVVDGLSLGMPQEQGGWNNTMIEDSDGVHPTARGHALYARSLAGKLL